jgi:hypothetical protein
MPQGPPASGARSLARARTALAGYERLDVAPGELRRPCPRVRAEAPPRSARDAKLDRNALGLDPNEVVGGVGERSRAQRRAVQRVHQQHARHRPDAGHAAMPSKHQINPTAAQQSTHIAGIEDLVALSSRARNRDQMVVADEHSQPCRTRECLLDPGVVLAPRSRPRRCRALGRIHRDQHEIGITDRPPQPHIPRAEDPLALR